MAELPVMRLHALAPEVKCPRCGASLAFIRVRGGYGDLYQCASAGQCKCQIMHYRSKEAQVCGYAVVYKYGAIGEWTACDMPAAKE
jgi:ssDNA-binding Zn-finger/Zn-ribbon topoisomerase 1